METELQNIIDKIHDEGVKEAEQRARKIVESAEKQAREKADHARQQAEEIVQQAEREAQKHRAAGEAALKQASRDLLLSVRKEVTHLFETVQKEAVENSLTPERMADVIVDMVKSWSTSESDQFEVLVHEKDQKQLETALRSALAEKLNAGVDVRPVRGITAGFRIGTKDGSAYYDFTDESLAEILSAFLNPRLAELMTSAAKE
ncbi:MAG TPA: V-type ATP synthase subunit E family protein [Alkalispirochaeta sp.]|nr:V-type ATP synthase subunit E family protein [Alkalispirochaeta sp.]